MALSSFSFMAKNILQLQNWFVDIYNHLSAKNYDNGTWTPVITGMTGTPTVTAWFQRFGIECWFTIILDGTHTMDWAEITLPLTPIGYGLGVIHSLTDNSNLGSAKVDTTTGHLHIRGYFVDTEIVIIKGFYKVKGI